MNSIQFIFGTSNHQPEGSVHSQFESAYQESYKPFLTNLNSFPDFPVVLHYSGSLLKWIQKNHPEFFMLLEEMVSRKQVELLGGGFYNPILSMIPNADKIGQMEMLTTFLRTNFGNRPRGCLLSGQVWEPGLAATLDSSGMEYTFLADRYFLIAGLEEKELFLPYLTEDQGKVISVFPLSVDLGRLMATYKSVEIIDYLKNAADSTGRRVASILIDGNKFTHKNEKWLIGFIEAVKKNSEWLIPVTSRKYMLSCW
jgi:alpha-amylase